MTNAFGLTNVVYATNDVYVSFAGGGRVPPFLIELLLVILAALGLWWYFNKKNINRN
jgi:hypothetical protein